MIGLLGALACSGPEPAPPGEPGGVDTGTPVTDSTTERDTDTGLTTSYVPVACPLRPCVAELAVAAWHGPVAGGNGGYAVVATDDAIVVGAPVVAGWYGPDATVFALDPEDLSETGSWATFTYQFTEDGASLAAADLDGDGAAEIAIGASNTQIKSDNVGAVYLVGGAPAPGEVLPDVALLSVYAPDQVRLGTQVRFAALGGGEVELLASGPGSASPSFLADGRLYAVDSAARGALFEPDVSRTILGPPGFGVSFDTPDLGGDGQPDLLVTTSAGVGWYHGPWVGNLFEADADGVFSGTDLSWNLGDHIQALGDVTGDGLPDAAMSAGDHGEPEVRAGRVYLVPGGPLTSMVADDLPDQVRGTEIGDGVGYALAGGDVDGDGTDDLIVGASGVYPGEFPGRVLVFHGPVSGVLEPDDAAAAFYGEHTLDFLGRSLAVTDHDGDEKADILAGAMGWPAFESRGALYLVLGADLFP